MLPVLAGARKHLALARNVFGAQGLEHAGESERTRDCLLVFFGQNNRRLIGANQVAVDAPVTLREFRFETPSDGSPVSGLTASSSNYGDGGFLKSRVGFLWLFSSICGLEQPLS